MYKRHEACKCMMTVQQDRLEARIDLRTDAGWTERMLTNADDPLVLTEFGLHCKLSRPLRGNRAAAGPRRRWRKRPVDIETVEQRDAPGGYSAWNTRHGAMRATSSARSCRSACSRACAPAPLPPDRAESGGRSEG